MKRMMSGAVAGAMLVIILMACMGISCGSDSVQKIESESQEEWMLRALAEVPIPLVENFLTREAVAKWIERQDTPDRLYYVYPFADNGNCLGYYVAQNRPVSICCALTSPDKVNGSGANKVVVQAPAMDGVYYNGGDDDQYYFFDAGTDAMIELTGIKFITSDQPLNIDADPIQVQIVP